METSRPVGGRLFYFSHNWKQITDDPWVLDTVTGLKLRFTHTPPPRVPRNTPRLSQDRENIGNRVRGPQSQGGHYQGTSRGRSGVYQPNVCGTKGGWGMEASDRSQGPQPLCCVPPLQDGVHPHNQGTGQPRRPAPETRLEGCVPLGTNPPKPQEIPQVPMADRTLAISGPPLRPQQCPPLLHQTHEADCINTPAPSHQINSLSGRHASGSEHPSGGQVTPPGSLRDICCTGVHCQHKEECIPAKSEAGISRLPDRHPDYADLTPSAEASLDPDSGETNHVPEDHHNPSVGQSPGHDDSSPPCGTTSPSAFPGPREGKDQSSQDGSDIQYDHPDLTTNGERSPVVDSVQPCPQWQTASDPMLGLDHRDRCISEGLGGQLPRQQCRGPLDSGGAVVSHKLPGAFCGIPGIENLPTRPTGQVSPLKNGQYHSDSLPKSDGGDPLPATLGPGSADMGVVHTQGSPGPCRTPARDPECQGRLALSPHHRLERLETEQGGIPEVRERPRPILHRCICIPDECSVAGLLQLETGPRSSSSGRPVNIMGTPQPVHVPSLCAYSTLPGEADGGEVLSNSHCSSLAQPNLVPQTPGMLVQPTHSSTSSSGYSVQPTRTTPPSGSAEPAPTSRLACVGRSYRSVGLSEGVISVLRRSWRESTESAYSSAWRKWVSWCLARATDPLSAPLNSILEFLYEQFQEGKQYRTVNSFRSAISMTHEELDGHRVGQHPLVCRFLKGVFNARPPMPRYSHTWDVDKVLSFLESQLDNEELSFQMLSHKLAMLMALTNADRCSDLVALDLNFLSYQAGGAKFIIPGLTKSRRAGPPIEAFYTEFPESPRLCPVRTLRAYENRSREFRRKPGEKNPLFIATRRPHKPVKACTIGK